MGPQLHLSAWCLDTQQMESNTHASLACIGLLHLDAQNRWIVDIDRIAQLQCAAIRVEREGDCTLLVVADNRALMAATVILGQHMDHDGGQLFARVRSKCQL